MQFHTTQCFVNLRNRDFQLEGVQNTEETPTRTNIPNGNTNIPNGKNVRLKVKNNVRF